MHRRYQGGFFSTVIAPQQTQNQFALLEFDLPKGAEPPPHIHQLEDEAFYVVEGQLAVSIADEVTALEPGAGIFAPRGIAHSFRILSPTARFLNLISPGSLWHYFMEFSSPVDAAEHYSNSTEGRPDLHRMLEVITQQYGVQFLVNAAKTN